MVPKEWSPHIFPIKIVYSQILKSKPTPILYFYLLAMLYEITFFS